TLSVVSASRFEAHVWRSGTVGPDATCGTSTRGYAAPCLVPQCRPLLGARVPPSANRTYKAIRWSSAALALAVERRSYLGVWTRFRSCARSAEALRLLASRRAGVG